MKGRQDVIDCNDGAMEEFRALVFFFVVYGKIRTSVCGFGEVKNT